MTAMQPVTGPAAQLVLASLFVEPRPERLAALRAAAADLTGPWQGIIPALELHGVLPLAYRNLRLAEVPLPGDLQTELRRRDDVLREDACRDALTMRRFLTAAEGERLTVVLLKGASLAVDLYPDPALRSQGDIDVLIAPSEVRGALRAGAIAGLLPSEQELPAWWYRLAHFHLKLHPTTRLLREVEIHWRLHSPALLLTDDLTAIRKRIIAAPVGGAAAWMLDPLDRLLHLVTHLASHWLELPERADRVALLQVLADAHPSVRLKWVVDIAAEIERIHEEIPAAALQDRAEEWSAEAELAWGLELASRGLWLPAAADSWVTEVRDGCRRGSTSPRRWRPSRAGRVSRIGAGTRPLPALDVRPQAILASLPRWLWPPHSYLMRRYRIAATSVPARALFVVRLVHLAGVSARIGTALVAFPYALLGRALLRRRRRRQRALALQPERVLDVATEWRGVKRDLDRLRAQES